MRIQTDLRHLERCEATSTLSTTFSKRVYSPFGGLDSAARRGDRANLTFCLHRAKYNICQHSHASSLRNKHSHITIQRSAAGYMLATHQRRARPNAPLIATPTTTTATTMVGIRDIFTTQFGSFIVLGTFLSFVLFTGILDVSGVSGVPSSDNLGAYEDKLESSSSAYSSLYECFKRLTRPTESSEFGRYVVLRTISPPELEFGEYELQQPWLGLGVDTLQTDIVGASYLLGTSMECIHRSSSCL